ncbi:MAG: Bsp6I family type II restriction endonuclease [Flavobacteriaceae bacterium]|nr:Bsp6I family type II restriction endonuclease [Flavobacteriaceae bacterium]
MKQENVKIILPEGEFNVCADIFELKDLKQLQIIYKDWISLCHKLRSFNARAINLPEGLSEVAFCLFTGTYRLNNPKLGKNVHTSFDAYCPRTHKRIQIKACSVIPDLTSFGPKSVWDEIYFLDFYKEGNWNGKFDVYHIPNALIYSQAVNKIATFQDFQGQGKRPRFSIFTEIIQRNSIQAITFDLFDENTILNRLPFTK